MERNTLIKLHGIATDESMRMEIAHAIAKDLSRTEVRSIDAMAHGRTVPRIHMTYMRPFMADPESRTSTLNNLGNDVRVALGQIGNEKFCQAAHFNGPLPQT